MILDTSIRFFVFVPTLIMSFLAGYLMKNIKYITRNEKELKLNEIGVNQAVVRSKLLLQNGRLISKESFSMRKHFFNDKQTGFFCFDKLPTNKNEPMPLSDLTSMVKNNIIDLFLFFGIAGLNNWMFSGFITTKLPFPVTLRFKPMLQRDIDMPQLDASWVSSISWYLMCIIGLRYIKISLFEKKDTDTGAEDEICCMTKDDIKKAWEDLEIYNHRWYLDDIDVI